MIRTKLGKDSRKFLVDGTRGCDSVQEDATERSREEMLSLEILRNGFFLMRRSALAQTRAAEGTTGAGVRQRVRKRYLAYPKDGASGS